MRDYLLPTLVDKNLCLPSKSIKKRAVFPLDNFSQCNSLENRPGIHVPLLHIAPLVAEDR